MIKSLSPAQTCPPPPHHHLDPTPCLHAHYPKNISTSYYHTDFKLEISKWHIFSQPRLRPHPSPLPHAPQSCTQPEVGATSLSPIWQSGSYHALSLTCYKSKQSTSPNWDFWKESESRSLSRVWSHKWFIFFPSEVRVLPVVGETQSSARHLSHDPEKSRDERWRKRVSTEILWRSSAFSLPEACSYISLLMSHSFWLKPLGFCDQQIKRKPWTSGIWEATAGATTFEGLWL